MNWSLSKETMKGCQRIKYNLKLIESGEAVYIGRGFKYHSIPRSKWHNPFHLSDYSRAEALARYRDYILRSPLMADLGELEGKTLCCHCEEGEPCHGDVLIELTRQR